MKEMDIDSIGFFTIRNAESKIRRAIPSCITLGKLDGPFLMMSEGFSFYTYGGMHCNNE